MCEDARNIIIERINEKYGKLMRHIASNILHDDYDVEDVIQTVLWKVISKHMDKLAEDAFKDYLCTAVRNTALNIYNKKQKLVETDPFLICEMTENTVDINAFHDIYGFGVELRSLIECLDNIDKDIICMRYGWKHSYADIAEAVGISEANARKRAERALKKLQIILLEKEVADNDK